MHFKNLIQKHLKILVMHFKNYSTVQGEVLSTVAIVSNRANKYSIYFGFTGCYFECITYIVSFIYKTFSSCFLHYYTFSFFESVSIA